MKRNAKTTNKRKNSRRYTRLAFPRADANSYYGPIVRPIERQARDTKTMVLNNFYTLTSTAGGVIADVIPGNPSNASNWADTNTVWGEYRLLGFSISFMPFNRYSKTTTNCVPFAVIIDRRNSTALASTTAAASHASCVMHSSEDPWTMSVKMSNAEESQFIAVSSPSAYQWFKFYASGLTVSTGYGYLLVTYRVQFRNVE